MSVEVLSSVTVRIAGRCSNPSNAPESLRKALTQKILVLQVF
jgi:hypothetical protein